MTCTYVFDEVVNYYNKNNTKVYALLLDASKAFDTCLSEFNRRLNVLLSTFEHAHAHVKYILFKTYCMPLYGSQIWIFSCTSCTRFITNWYKAVRRIFNLPPLCHRRFVYQIAGDMPGEMQLLCRFLKFFLNCMNNNKKQYGVYLICLLCVIAGSYTK